MKLARLAKSRGKVDPTQAAAPWAEALDRVDTLPLSDLARLHRAVPALRQTLDRFDQASSARLADAQSVRIPPHLGAALEWAGRPLLWSARCDPVGHVQPPSGVELGQGAKLFHDCPLAEITIGQRRNPRREHLAHYAMALDVLRFQGSFLSLALDLPDAALSGLSRGHVLTADFDTQSDRPLGIYVRLNLRCGPNVATMLREVPRDGSGTAVEFDLAYSDLDAARLEAGWIDVMFEAPAMMGLILRDLTLIRSRRADL